MIVYQSANDSDLNKLKELHAQAKSELKKIEAPPGGSAPINTIPGARTYIINTLRDSKSTLIEKTHIGRNLFFDSLDRIEGAYRKLLENDSSFGSEALDLRENFSLIFFHNSLAFLKMVKMCFPIVASDQKFQLLLNEIKKIRDFFSHAHEKEFNHQEVIARISINHHNPYYNENGLYELEIFDLASAKKIFRIFYSLDYFYFELQNIVLNLIPEVEKSIKKS